MNGYEFSCTNSSCVLNNQSLADRSPAGSCLASTSHLYSILLPAPLGLSCDKTYSILQETLLFSWGSQNGLHPGPRFQAAWPVSKIRCLFLDLSSDSCLLVFLPAACHSLVRTSSVLSHMPPLNSTLTFIPIHVPSQGTELVQLGHHQLSKPCHSIWPSHQRWLI